MNQAKRKSSYGFTLVELLVTFAVVGIIAAIGVPSLRGFIVSNRLTGYANDLLAAISLARSESIRRGQRVVLCPIAAAEGGTPDTSACVDPVADSWAGWMIFADVNRNSAWDAGEEVIRADVFGGGASVVLAGASLRNASNQIVFLPSGIARENGTGAIQQFNLRVCESGVTLAQNLRDVVMVSGSRVSVQRGSDDACGAPA